MQHTRIEWVKNPDGSQGYTWNPITGCLNGCSYCYARKLANGRLKSRYLANENYAPLIEACKALEKEPEDHPLFDPFYPRFWPEKLDEVWELARGRHFKARGIFACDMSDLFGIGIPEEWTKEILDAISHAGPHRFYLLTKQPQNLIKWSPFPENCYIGVSATNQKQYDEALKYLKGIKAKVKFLSFEPLLEHIVVNPNDLKEAGISWVTGGQQTPVSKKTEPEVSWLREIVEATDKAGIPVFLKDNLKPLIKSFNEKVCIECEPSYPSQCFTCSAITKLRQEFPKVKEVA